MGCEIRAVVLAAGRGTRLNSEGDDIPKVMRPAGGKPLLGWVLDALSFIPRKDTVIVVGYKKNQIISSFDEYIFTQQEEQLGTGHALLSALPAFTGFEGDILVCCGDMPLLRRETYEALVWEHFKDENSCTLLSGISEDPSYGSYGRIRRSGRGEFLGIVEAKDCTKAELEISEFNAGVYVFKAPLLFPALSELRANNSQAEYYLTDVPGILKGFGERVGICRRELRDEILGVNTAEQLARVDKILRNFYL